MTLLNNHVTAQKINKFKKNSNNDSDKGHGLKLSLVIFVEKESPMKIDEFSLCKLFILNHK